MNNVWKALSLAGTLSLAACESSTNAPATEVKANTKTNASTYSLRGIDNSWPPAIEKQQSISSNLLAKNYYLVVDTSGSMNERGCSVTKPKLEVAKGALRQFVSKLPADANIGLLMFDNGRAKETISIGPNTHSSITNAIQSVKEGGGGTPLGTAIRSGYNSLTDQAQTQLGYGEYHLVIVTDGYADKGNEPDNIVRSMLKGSAINIHTIGFCIDENHALNLPGHTIYKSAGNPKALMEGLDSVLAEAPDFQISGFGQ
jgi:Mg-chelatase subunit ChlD